MQEERDELDEKAPGLAEVVRDNVASIDWRSLFNLRMLGFALARAWVYLLFIGAATSSATWTGEVVPQAVFSVSTLALFAVMFGAALLSDRLDVRVYQNPTRLLGPVLTCLGTLAVASTPLVGDLGRAALIVVGGVLTGVGSGLVDLAWGEVYRHVPSRQVCLEAPLSFLIAAVIFFFAGLMDSSVAACLLVTLLPAASGWILFVNLRAWSPDNIPAAMPVPVPMRGFAQRVGLCAALVGVADACVRIVFLDASGVPAHEFYHVPLLVAGIVTLAVIWGCVVAARTFNLRSIYRIAMIIMAFFFQLLPIFVGSAFENVIALAGYGTFNVLIWILLADVCYRYRLSALRVFGIGWSMITLGVFAGSLLGRGLVAWLAPFTPQALSTVALVATIAVLLSYMFVLTDADLIALTEQAEALELRREEGRGGGRASGAEDVVAEGGSRGSAAEATGRAFSAEGMEEPARTAEAAGALPGGGQPDAAAVAGARRDGNDVAPKPQRFVSRCMQVARECGLTERETEIMILYAKGRSYARIQEELYLSRGTITTHLRHIYTKMDVHNKQEFLDYIEGYRHETD